MKDYSIYKQNGRFYSGTEDKIGITIDGADFIVKFQKKTDIGLIDNHFSEYLGSHIFQCLSIESQKTFLGLYKGREVVLMQDFTSRDEQFVPFNDVGDSTLEEDKERFQYSYSDIMTILKANTKLTEVAETITRFWDMYLVDALIGNFDRHGGNWGFLKKNNKYKMAPIFDNGSSFFPRLNTDERLTAVMNNENEMLKRVYSFPTSQIRIGNMKSSYFDVISSLSFPECNKALLRVVPRIDLSQISSIINSVSEWSDIRKRFYASILKARYIGLLRNPYENLCHKMN